MRRYTRKRIGMESARGALVLIQIEIQFNFATLRTKQASEQQTNKQAATVFNAQSEWMTLVGVHVHDEDQC